MPVSQWHSQPVPRGPQVWPKAVLGEGAPLMWWETPLQIPTWAFWTGDEEEALNFLEGVIASLKKRKCPLAHRQQICHPMLCSKLVTQTHVRILLSQILGSVTLNTILDLSLQFPIWAKNGSPGLHETMQG